MCEGVLQQGCRPVVEGVLTTVSTPCCTEGCRPVVEGVLTCVSGGVVHRGRRPLCDNTPVHTRSTTLWVRGCCERGVDPCVRGCCKRGRRPVCEGVL